jgi:tetratricopeptide (TPR) repeat protein
MMDQARQEADLPLEELVANDPTTALYLPLAERLREQGKLTEAILLCEERRLRPGSGVGDRIVLGRAYLADGRLPEARAEFEAALTLDRENVVALKALAGITSHTGDHAQAAAYYRAVCRVDPADLESQTALHQITSGEYAEVRPPDVIIGPSDLAWQPIRLPREEEHLSELALGLRTIERFDAVAPTGAAPVVQEFQGVTFEAVPEGGPETAPEATSAEAPSPVAEDLQLEPVTAVVAAPAPPPASAGSFEPPPAGEPAPSALGRAPASAPRPIVQGNRSAFQDWIRRIAGNDR